MPVLLLHLVLLLAYSSLVPLGEAPDEPAHLSYAQFLARHGRLPATLAERREAGYRSVWPPLYQMLVAGPLAWLGESPPERLKSVGDTPRRLIPTNGQTIASFIHTADESWPWRGLPLAWHVGRLVSVMLTTLSVIVTYTLTWQLTGRQGLATATAVLHACLPQILFMGSVLNDDNLMILLSGLILLALVIYTKKISQLRLGHAFCLGALLGLATVAKYNVLPLWVVVFGWGGWLVYQRVADGLASRSDPGRPSALLKSLASIIVALAALLAGAALTGGWWFVFIWRHFNQVGRLGLVRGSLATLSAGTSDVATRKLLAGTSIPIPPVSAWIEWLSTFFRSFWGLFGGGGTIAFPNWVYWLLAFFSLLALAEGLWTCYEQFLRPHASSGRLPAAKFDQAGRETGPARVNMAAALLLLSPLLFLPLPLLRFCLAAGNIGETAQARHLFPVLAALLVGLVWGASRLGEHASKFAPRLARLSRSDLSGPAALLLFVFGLNFYALQLIPASYPPPIPLRTTADAATARQPVRIEVAAGIRLVGYELGQAGAGILPVSLVWQARAIPAEDYLIELTVLDETGQAAGGWLGYPLGGRYPTRAWDKGDILRHTIPVPLLPGSPARPTSLLLRLLDSRHQPVAPALTLAENVALPAVPLLPHPPAELRADELAPDSVFTYRSTLSLAWPGPAGAPELFGPRGIAFPAALVITGQEGGLAHFIVEANWPSGDYRLKTQTTQFTVHITNRPRQFEPPPMAYIVKANFAGQLTLLGYDLPQRRVQPDQSFPVSLYWQAEQTPGQDLTVFNHLLDHAGVQRGGADRIPKNYYTTLLWAPGEIVFDAYEVPVKADAPPGVYWLDVGLYPSDRPTFSLPLVVDGQPLDQTGVRLGPIKVGGPPPGLVVAEAAPEQPLNVLFGGQITLLGCDLVDASGNSIKNNQGASLNPQSPGLDLKLYWRAEARPVADYTVFVHLLNRQGELAGQADSPPASGAYPTSLWEAGEIIVDEHPLPNLPPGNYTLQAGLYRPDTGERLPAAGAVDGAVKLIQFELKGD